MKLTIIDTPITSSMIIDILRKCPTRHISTPILRIFTIDNTQTPTEEKNVYKNQMKMLSRTYIFSLYDTLPHKTMIDLEIQMQIDHLSIKPSLNHRNEKLSSMYS